MSKQGAKKSETKKLQMKKKKKKKKKKKQKRECRGTKTSQYIAARNTDSCLSDYRQTFQSISTNAKKTTMVSPPAHFRRTPCTRVKKSKKKLDNRKTKTGVKGEGGGGGGDMQSHRKNSETMGQSARGGEGWILQYVARSSRLRFTILK